MKEKLIQKLSSRKLWAAILAGVGAVLVALVGEDLAPEVVDALKAGISAAIAYIFGEGLVDSCRLIAEAIKAFGEKKSTEE